MQSRVCFQCSDTVGSASGRACKQVAQLSHRDRTMHELLRIAKLRSGIFEPPFWRA